MKKPILFLIVLNLFFTARSQSWNINGNTGINPTINFLGTRDNNPLRFRVNNHYAGEIDSATTKAFFGYAAGMNTTSGLHNVTFGNKSLFSNVSGSYNSAVGSLALYSNLSFWNTAIGYAVLYSNTSGNSNSAMGNEALYNNISGAANTAVGSWSLYSNISGYSNSAFGRHALYSNTIGNSNTAVGVYSAFFNTSGIQNTSLGYQSNYLNNTGSYNTAVGGYSLYATSNSQYNVAVGYNSGGQYDMGYNNTFLGANCSGSFNGQYNVIAIGQGVVCPYNSTARVGNSATWSIGGYANWTNISDGRFKKNIKENVKGLDFIMKLRPVTYHLDITGLSKQSKENGGEEWNDQMKKAIAEKEKIIFSGFVAQEVEQAAKEVKYDFSGVDKPMHENGLYGLRYAEFVVPLVKAMQEQQDLIRDLQSKVQKLQEQADVTVVMRENIITEKLSAFPNPTTNNLTITIATQTAGEGSLSFFDSGGRLVKQMNINIQEGMNTINLSIPNLAAGYYNLKLDWGQGMHKQVSIVKQ
jgi:trimeric autotransporter adhesin